ncbi:MAG: monomethylamine:corrinoid methyltransferase [Chloroflexi bacterium]|nr:monomethylamine:corrinoid methyltransferase [Chloroflexota bacterium]
MEYRGHVSLKEFIKRSMYGPVMTEQEFDLKLSQRLRRLSADFSVHFNPGEIICDDATADGIFQAAVELLGQVGLYNTDTNRVVNPEPGRVGGRLPDHPQNLCPRGRQRRGHNRRQKPQQPDGAAHIQMAAFD